MGSPFGSGIAFTVEEHEKLQDWSRFSAREYALTLDLALNYPDTPEVFGVIEDGWKTPTFFFWRTSHAIVAAPFSGIPIRNYASIEELLIAISEWASDTSARRQTTLKPQKSRLPE